MKTSRVLLLAALVASCHVDELLQAPGSGSPPVGSSGPRLDFAQQPGQATAGEPIGPVKVAVLDSLGQPVADFTGPVTINLQNPGGATLLGTKEVPAVDGVATFSDLSINKAGDDYRLHATASGASAATSDPIDIKAPPGNLTVTATISGVSLDLDGYTVTVDDDQSKTVGSGGGNATFTGLEAGDHEVELRDVEANCTVSGSPRTVPVSSGETAQTQFTITCTGAPPPPPPPPSGSTHLRFTDHPTTTQAGRVMQGRGGGVRVTVFDGSGNQLTNFTGTVTLALGSNPGNGTLAGAQPVLITSSMGGVAEWQNLTIDNPGNGYTLRATSDGVGAAQSDPFDITAGPPPPLAGATGLGFSQPPTTTPAGSTISPAVQVVALGCCGGVATGFNGAIWITIESNPAGGTLSGTRRAVAVNGVATFPGLSINTPGTGYTLRATAWPLNAKTSPPFNITAP